MWNAASMQCCSGRQGNPCSRAPLRKLKLQVVAAKPKDGKDGDDKADPRKADFSAYWSLKIGQLFSRRRKYLDAADQGSLPEPEIVKKLNQEAAVDREKLKVLQQEWLEDSRLSRLRRQAVEIEAAEEADKLLAPVKRALVKEEDMVEDAMPDDIKRAKAYMHSGAVHGLSMAWLRARQLVYSIVLLPYTLATALSTSWSNTFNSSRYENFLMSEGERIWFWRNRQENERWFWEIFFWDRLLFPIICTAAYEYIVPNNIMWAIVVPASFILWQTGQILSPANFEFWLIAYFGGPKIVNDLAWLSKMLFRWG